MALNVIRVSRWFQAIFTFVTAGMIVTFISERPGR
jgi:hypothetical protein